MLLTAKELRKELNISIELWRYWKNQRKAKHYNFPEPDGVKFIDKNHPKAEAWELSWFKEWWEARPKVGRQFTDITNL